VNPFTEVRLVGRKAKIIRAPAHTDIELQTWQSLVPCPAEQSTLIDRFDGRALIDPIPKGGWEVTDTRTHTRTRTYTHTHTHTYTYTYTHTHTHTQGRGDDGNWGECSAPTRTQDPPPQRQKAEMSLAAYESYKDPLS